jgi:hypothetical protein
MKFVVLRSLKEYCDAFAVALLEAWLADVLADVLVADELAVVADVLAVVHVAVDTC